MVNLQRSTTSTRVSPSRDRPSSSTPATRPTSSCTSTPRVSCGSTPRASAPFSCSPSTGTTESPSPSPSPRRMATPSTRPPHTRRRWAASSRATSRRRAITPTSRPNRPWRTTPPSSASSRRRFARRTRRCLHSAARTGACSPRGCDSSTPTSWTARWPGRLPCGPSWARTHPSTRAPSRTGSRWTPRPRAGRHPRALPTSEPPSPSSFADRKPIRNRSRRRCDSATTPRWAPRRTCWTWRCGRRVPSITSPWVTSRTRALTSSTGTGRCRRIRFASRAAAPWRTQRCQTKGATRCYQRWLTPSACTTTTPRPKSASTPSTAATTTRTRTGNCGTTSTAPRCSCRCPGTA